VAPREPDAFPELVVASSCGVGFVDWRSGQVADWEDRSHGLPHRIVYTLTAWDGHLVAGTNDGLALREGTGRHTWTAYRAGQIPLEDNWITALAVTATGQLAVGTYSAGVWWGPSLDALTRLPGPSRVNLGALWPDPDGGLWVGALSDGLYRVSAEGLSEQLTSGPCLTGLDVTGFAEWEGRLVVGTRTGVSVCGVGLEAGGWRLQGLHP
jgi:ligand-binding sensor domain-containing protein